MISREEATEKLQDDVLEIIPTDKERICIPVTGFVGAKEEDFTDWEGKTSKIKGYKFLNETDNSEQLAAVENGVIMCYEGQTPDGKKRSEAIKEYLDRHKLATKTIGGVQNLVNFVKSVSLGESGKPDVYTTDTGFVAKKILGAPAKEDIKAGQMIVGQKVAGTLKAFRVAPGIAFEGAAGTSSSQIAGKDGAYIIQDKDGTPRMIQAAEFKAAYKITKVPTGQGRDTRQLSA